MLHGEREESDVRLFYFDVSARPVLGRIKGTGSADHRASELGVYDKQWGSRASDIDGGRKGTGQRRRCTRDAWSKLAILNVGVVESTHI